MTMIFHRRRPASHYRANGEMHRYPVTRPDALKLARAVEDALTGIIWLDDAQIVEEHLTKRWSDEEGVHVTVDPTGGHRLLGASR